MKNSVKNKNLGILVGGGPAPGINGVISAATIEAINRGMNVIGLRDGFKWLVNGDKTQVQKLTIEDTSPILLRGGSILRTSRENPTKSPQKMKQVLKTLNALKINYLLTIGGDDTMLSASRVEAGAKGKIKVAHVPKTIDNDLPLPRNIPTFGYVTARHVGTEIVQYLIEDAKTTSRWYIVVTMGRKTGHLALGIGKASGATITIIPEEFNKHKINVDAIVKIIEGSIIKRKGMNREHGVVIIAEGLVEKLKEEELKDLKDVERDEHGHIRYSEIDLGKLIKNETKQKLLNKGIQTTIVQKNIGYELRSAPPTPFDATYTRDLGYGAVKYLVQGGSGALISIQEGKMIPIKFNDILDPITKKFKIRYLDTDTESHEVARKYMIKLNKEDLKDKKNIKKLSKIASMKEKEFIKYFSEVV